MAERNGRCKEVYDTCPQHIGFLSGFAVSLEFDELKGTRFSPAHLSIGHCVRGRPPRPGRSTVVIHCSTAYAQGRVYKNTNMNKTWDVTPFKTTDKAKLSTHQHSDWYLTSIGSWLNSDGESNKVRIIDYYYSISRASVSWPVWRWLYRFGCLAGRGGSPCAQCQWRGYRRGRVHVHVFHRILMKQQNPIENQYVGGKCHRPLYIW